MAEPARRLDFDDSKAKRVENQRILFLDPQVKTEELVALLAAIADDISSDQFAGKNQIRKHWLYFQQSEATLQWANTFSVNPGKETVTDFTQGILNLTDVRQILAEASNIIVARFANSLPSHWKAVLQSFTDLEHVRLHLDSRVKLHDAIEAIEEVLTEKEREVKKPSADASIVLPEPYKQLLGEIDRQEEKFFDFPDARLDALSPNEAQKRRKELHQDHLFKILTVLSGFTDLPEGAEAVTLSNFPTRVPHVRDFLNIWLYYSHTWAKNQKQYPQIGLLDNPQYFPSSKINALFIDLDQYSVLNDKPAVSYFGRVVRGWLEVLEKPIEGAVAASVSAAEAEVEGGGDPEVIDEVKRKKPDAKPSDEELLVNVAEELAEAGFTYRLEAVRLQNFLLPQFLAAHGFEDVDVFLGSMTSADQSVVIDTFRREFLKELESTLRTLSSEQIAKLNTPEGRVQIRLELASKLMYRLSANTPLVGAVQAIKEEYVTQQAQRSLTEAVRQRPELAAQDNSILLQQYRESARQAIHAKAQALEELVQYNNLTNDLQKNQLELLFPDAGAVELEKLGKFQSYKQNLRGSITQLLQLGGFSANDEAFILTKLDVLLASKTSPDQLKLLNRQQFAAFFGVQLPAGVSARAYTGLLYCLSEYSQQRMVVLADAYGLSIAQTQHGTLDHHWAQINQDLIKWLSDTPQQDIRRQLALVLDHLSADDRQGLFEFLNNNQYDAAAKQEFLAKLTAWVQQRHGDVDGVLPAWIQQALEHENKLKALKPTPKSQLEVVTIDNDFYKHAAIAQAQTPQSLRYLADHPDHAAISGIFNGLHSEVQSEWQKELLERLRTQPEAVAAAMAAGVPLSRLSQYLSDEEDVPDDASEDLREKKRQYLQLLAEQILREELAKERELEHAQIVQDLVLAGADISYNNFTDPNGGVQFNDEPADTRQLEQLPARSPLGGQDQPTSISRAGSLARSAKKFVETARTGQRRLKQANMARKAAVTAGRAIAANPAAAGVGLAGLLGLIIGALTQSVAAGAGAIIGGIGGGFVGFWVGGPIGAAAGFTIGTAAGGAAGYALGGGAAGSVSAGASSVGSGLGSMLPNLAGGATAASSAISGTSASALASSSTFLAGSGVAAIMGTAALAIVNQGTLMGAFLPPLATVGSDGQESLYVTVEKIAKPQGGSALPGNKYPNPNPSTIFEYQVTIRANKGYDLYIRNIEDTFKVTRNTELNTDTNDITPPSPITFESTKQRLRDNGMGSFIQNIDGQEVIFIPASGGDNALQVAAYTVEFNSSFHDAGAANTVTINFDAKNITTGEVKNELIAETGRVICFGECPQSLGGGCWPTSGKIVQYPYQSSGACQDWSVGCTHKSLDAFDIVAPLNETIYAPFEGRACGRLKDSGYGTSVRMQTNVNGVNYELIFGHMSRFETGLGSCKDVQPGDIIGYVNDTGFSAGNHLHYEVRPMGGSNANSNLRKLIPPEDADITNGAFVESCYAQATFNPNGP
jgi:hypothetical protein